MNRMVITGRNDELGMTPFQEKAFEADMFLYTAYIHARQAGEALLRAHTLRKSNAEMTDVWHTEAMKELDKLATALGVELVPRGESITR